MSASVHFTASSLQEMNRAIRSLETVGGKSAVQAVQYAALKFAQSGRAQSKLSKARRKIEPNTGQHSNLKSRKTHGAQYRIVVKHQGKPDTYLPTNRKSDPRRKIKNRGVAKNSWSGVLAKMHRASGRNYANGSGRGLGTAEQRLRGANPFITIINRVKYLENAYPGIGSIAMQKAARGMQHQLDNKVARDLQRGWSK